MLYQKSASSTVEPRTGNKAKASNVEEWSEEIPGFPVYVVLSTIQSSWSSCSAVVQEHQAAGISQ